MKMKSLFFKLKSDPRIKNSLWMFVEKGISLFGLIFIISAVAKYTGPSIYGEISLAASIFIVLKTIAQLGLDQTFFKYVSEKKPYYNLFLFYAIKLISLIFILVFFLVFLWSIKFSSYTGFWFIVATGIAYYFNSIDLINFFNEGRLLSKLNVFANIVGLTIALVLRYIVVIFKLNVLYLCFPIVIMTLIPFLIKFYFYRSYVDQSKFCKKNKNLKYYKYFIYTGVPLTLSILTVSINSQIANYFLAYFEGTKSVGVYSVAFILAGAWCIIPTTIIMSFLTTIYATNNYQNYIALSRKLFISIVLISLILILILILLSDFIIDFLYGPQYFKSIFIFRILLFYQFFWVIGFYFSRLILKFNGFGFLAYKSIFTCILNLILSFVLIKKYGMLGAAYSVLISEIVSSMFFNMFYRKANLLKIINPFGAR